MDAIKKQHILNNCNELSVDQIFTLIKENHLTIEDFKEAGLSSEAILLIQKLELENSNKEIEIKKTSENALVSKQLIQDVISGKRSAMLIKDEIKAGKYTFEDLENLNYDKTLSFALKRYISDVNILSFKKIEDLKPMDINRTDLYLVGVPGSGKSTILASLFKQAMKRGILLPDPYNQDGSIYQDSLISNLNKGILPEGTAKGSYNYVAFSMQDDHAQNHPFNVVEVPGELYVNMYKNGEVDSFLKYIKNPNKKILAFIIDSLAHDTGYVESNNQIDQSLIYVNIIQMFKQNGVLEEVDAIYLIANKFDAIKESRYKYDENDDVDLSNDFLQEEFLNLINNCKAVRESGKNKFKIKVLPFSIGDVANEFLFKNYNVEYPSNLIDELLEDSFIVKQKKTGFFR